MIDIRFNEYFDHGSTVLVFDHDDAQVSIVMTPPVLPNES